MRKHFLILIFIVGASLTVNSQSRGIRIGYIDMEYILQNVPDYLEAKNQLELKAQKWKQEIEVKKNEITRQKETLKTERVLLTKELLEEREEEITFLETELSDLQQKRFGPTGELVVQKAVMVKPIQDQIFTVVQDLAEIKKYDFIFDKSSDLTMLFAAKRYDISDIVIRRLTRSSKRDQLSKKEIKAEEAKEYKEDVQDENSTLAERQKKLDEKKAAREAAKEKTMADRKAAVDAKKNAAAAKRQQLVDDKEAKKNGTTTPAAATAKEGEKTTTTKEEAKPTTAAKVARPSNDSIVATREAAKKEAAETKAKDLEARKKALQEKRDKAIADREAAKKAKQAKTSTDTIKSVEKKNN